MSEPIPYPTSQAAYPVTRPAATPQVHEPLRLDEPVVEESIAEAPVESEVAVANETFDHLLEGSGDQETEQVESAPEEVAPLNQPVFFALKPVGAPVIEPVEEPVTEPVEERRTAPVFGVREQEPAEESEPEDYEEPAEESEPEAYEEPAEESELELVEEPQLETVEAQEDVEPISPFEISPTLVMEPQTNSIVIAEIPDPIRVADIVTDSGLILKTDSIEIVPVTTGQIEIIPESPESDVADSLDSAASFVPSVAPVRASGVMNSKALVGALPSRRRRVMDLTVTSVTLGIAILTVSVLAVLGYMLGVLK